MNFVAAFPRMMTPEITAEYVGGQKIMDALVSEKLLSARVKCKGCTRYDRLECDAALDSWKGFAE